MKVLIKRRFKKGKEEEIHSLLRKFRGRAMHQPGYVSGETLVDVADIQKSLVIATWKRLDDWNAWKNNPERKEFELMLEIFQEGQTDYETYYIA